MDQSNFSYFDGRWDILFELGKMAERNVYDDPNTTIMKLRVFAETLAKYLLAFEEIKEAYNVTRKDRIDTLRREDLVHPELYDMFDTIHRKGNKAVHEAGYGTTEDAKVLLRMAFCLGVWFMEVYGSWDFEKGNSPIPVIIKRNGLPLKC